VKVLDANILLYAVNRASARHDTSKAWLERAFSGTESVAVPWIVVLAFLRLSTNPRIFPTPLEPEEAADIVDGWLARPVVTTTNPGPKHWQILKSLLQEAGTAGNLTTDAHLAALAIEHGTELASFDTDFARFEGLRWVNPLDETSVTDSATE
jgi:uncharacterized protein